MTAAEFINSLEAKQLISASMSEKLRKKVSSPTSKPLTAKSLARFLIEKGHLSQEDAMAALAAGGEIEAPKLPSQAAPASLLASSCRWTSCRT